jgi:hypothetical protein
MRLILTALCIAIPLSSHAFEPKVSAILQDNGLTPAERARLGQTESGIQDVNSPLHCSGLAAQRAVGLSILPNEALLSGVGSKDNVPVSFFTREILTSLNRATGALAALGDTEINQKRVCVGIYNWGELNARSYSEGYIMVDPIAIREMWNMPTRTMFSDQQVYLHEFAHQLQYWYGNPFQADKTVRRSELAADCVASALLHLSWRGLNENILSMEALGIVASAERVGDDNQDSPQHHGTAEERKRAVLAGKNLIDAHFLLMPSGAGLTGRRILSRCNEMVKSW